MKLAIIGCGSIGTRHLQNALALGCDCYVLETDAARRAQVQAAFPLARVFGLLGGDETFDAWLVCTPYDNHLWWVEEAVRRRVPVFVEKPLGSLDQIEDWRGLVKASEGLVTQAGFNWRFDSRARTLRAFVAKPVAGRFDVTSDMSRWPGRSYGPFLLEGLSHEIDLALWCGAPNDVTSAECADGVYQIRLGIHFALYGHGSDRYGGGRYWKLAQHDREGFVSLTNEPIDNQMYLAELDHFLSCVRENRQTDVPLSEGLKVLEVCAQIEAMARQHA